MAIQLDQLYQQKTKFDMSSVGSSKDRNITDYIFVVTQTSETIIESGCFRVIQGPPYLWQHTF